MINNIEKYAVPIQERPLSLEISPPSITYLNKNGDEISLTEHQKTCLDILMNGGVVVCIDASMTKERMFVEWNKIVILITKAVLNDDVIFYDNYGKSFKNIIPVNANDLSTINRETSIGSEYD